MNTIPDPTDGQPTQREPGSLVNTQMARPSRRRTVAIVVFTCIVSTLVGTFFGGWAGAAYSLPLGESRHHGHLVPLVWAVGLSAGAVGGLAVAAAWCARLMRRAERSGAGLLRHGTMQGILAGVACTLMVHIPLIFIGPRSHHLGVVVLPVGLVMGAVAGAIVGAIGGRLMQRMADAGSPTDEAPRAPSASEG